MALATVIHSVEWKLARSALPIAQPQLKKRPGCSLPAGSFLFGAYPRSARWMPTITALIASVTPPNATASAAITWRSSAADASGGARGRASPVQPVALLDRLAEVPTRRLVPELVEDRVAGHVAITVVVVHHATASASTTMASDQSATLPPLKRQLRSAPYPSRKLYRVVGRSY